MHIERDVKIILIFSSITGIIWFTILYFLIAITQGKNPIDDFNLIQNMIFTIIIFLTLILIGSIYSLKKEITNQIKYLEKLKDIKSTEERYVLSPYNKTGLYSIIIASVVGIIIFLILYTDFVLNPQEHHNLNTGTISMMVFVFLIILFFILFISFFTLIRRIRMPLYYCFKACPRCNGKNIHKIEYSWWGGLIGPALVHQVRCNDCGKTYNGVTGTDITKKMLIYVLISNIICTILVLLRFIF